MLAPKIVPKTLKNESTICPKPRTSRKPLENNCNTTATALKKHSKTTRNKYQEIIRKTTENHCQSIIYHKKHIKNERECKGRPRQKKARQGKTSQDKTRQDKTRRYHWETIGKPSGNQWKTVGKPSEMISLQGCDSIRRKTISFMSVLFVATLNC